MHDAIVLAAGGSRRLGQAKQLLQRDGEPLIHRAARLAVESGARRVCVVLGAQAEAMHDALQALPVDVLVNCDWSNGLGSSLAVAAAALAGDAGSCLILGCDQPALHEGHLRWLVAAAASATSGCAATSHGNRLGVPAVVTAAVLRDARALSGDRGLRDSLAGLPLGCIAVLEAPELEIDLDTPEDVARARARQLIDAED